MAQGARSRRLNRKGSPMALGRVFIGCDIAHHREGQSSA
jgi:hypothetical protein